MVLEVVLIFIFMVCFEISLNFGLTTSYKLSEIHFILHLPQFFMTQNWM